MSQIGKNLRRLRRERGLTQRELARRAGTSSQMIGYWENGTRNPNGASRQKLASALGVDVGQLLASDQVVQLGPGNALRAVIVLAHYGARVASDGASLTVTWEDVYPRELGQALSEYAKLCAVIQERPEQDMGFRNTWERTTLQWLDATADDGKR
ncbi:MAG: helix-turn-helix domain-containing protein [Clostridiales bacterium]|nr:helix-turn-helix domain-containing protein [Clostridiales bacterium]